MLMLAIVVSCTSCIREPESVAFITSHVNVPITLYNDRDSVHLVPLQRTYLCHVEVKDGKFVGCTGMNWTFSLFDPVLKIGLLDTIYTVPEQYQTFLSDVDNYMHHLGYSSSSSSPVKYEHSCYDYTLLPDFVEEILRASVANK
ncbi:MAG: hypothetical protein J6A35_01535 [Paludibacteraceae bacterium]|nr:hypothetical protein [Paludibacteraceae bacterium]